MCFIQRNKKKRFNQIFKYVPLLAFDGDEEGILENVWCDYFLDGCTSGETSIRHYSDCERFKGFKGFIALNKEKSWVVRIEIIEDKYWGKIDCYMKVRRVKIKGRSKNARM